MSAPQTPRHRVLTIETNLAGESIASKLGAPSRLALPPELLQYIFEGIAYGHVRDMHPVLAKVLAISSVIRKWLLPIIYPVFIVDCRVRRQREHFEFLVLNPECEARSYIRHIVFLGPVDCSDHAQLFPALQELRTWKTPAVGSEWAVESVAGYGSFRFNAFIRAQYVHFVAESTIPLSNVSHTAYSTHAAAALAVGAHRMRFRFHPKLSDAWLFDGVTRQASSWKIHGLVDDVRLQLVLPGPIADRRTVDALHIAAKMINHLLVFNVDVIVGFESPVIVNGVPDEVATVPILKMLYSRVSSKRRVVTIHSMFARHSLEPDIGAMEYAEVLWREIKDSRGFESTPPGMFCLTLLRHQANSSLASPDVEEEPEEFK